MHKYAYMAWDRNFSYFCDNWRKKRIFLPPPGCAGRRNAYKEDARSSKETVGQLERVRESYGGSFSFSLNKKKFVFTCDSFADTFVSIPCRDCFR